MTQYETGLHVIDDFLNTDFNKILKKIIQLPITQELETPGGSKNISTLHNILRCYKTKNFDEVDPSLHRYFRKKLQRIHERLFTS